MRIQVRSDQIRSEQTMVVIADSASDCWQYRCIASIQYYILNGMYCSADSVVLLTSKGLTHQGLVRTGTKQGSTEVLHQLPAGFRARVEALCLPMVKAVTWVGEGIPCLPYTPRQECIATCKALQFLNPRTKVLKPRKS